ncbi:alpha/beta hydrolase [Kitasatospora sp. NBC_01246]|uniref:alpha/beta hydrolase n=1 Tax=Kitasatospora sp. NBC_01246 TaxID=2903570 RepID=UPI002E34375A|nr:alpha/beta hydrolase [Kitasatospora sp. NBC_01246]
MRFLVEEISDGVSERRFTHGDVPGVLWTPAGAVGGRPLVLLGHGGGGNSRTPVLAARARRLVTEYGFAVVAVDTPGHGDRPRSARDAWFEAEIGALLAAGEPLSRGIAEHTAALAERAVPEWRAVLDALGGLDEVGAEHPVGYWGLSLASVVGLPLVAAEPRITAAVLGLAGHESLTGAAARVTVPVRFVLQWDDELVERTAGFALFDALGSAEKTLHANPGGHAGVPAAELESAARFLERHLRAPVAPGLPAGSVF